jgi:peroxiredoxin
MGRLSWLGARIILTAMCAVLAAAVLPGTAAAEFGEEKFKVGDAAVDFTAPDLDGNAVTLSSFKGSKVVVLNFWGLRCGACIEEMPHLNALYREYKEKGVEVIGVGTDGVDAQTTRDTMKEVGISAEYPLLLDQEFTITDTYTNFLVPLTIVIDKSGIITFIHTGYEKGNEKDYEDAVVKALGS